jgi:hypothetical protein
MNLINYIKYFIIGGVLTLIGEIIINKFNNGIALSSYLYGAVPTIYLLLLWFSYLKTGKKGYDTFIVHSLINCGMFYIILLLLFILTYFYTNKKFNIFMHFFLALIIFIILSIIYFWKFYKKNFYF